MNILIIPSFFRNAYDETLGGFFWEQALALRKAGCNVFILYADTYSVKDFKKWLHYGEKREEETEGIKIFRDRVFCPMKHHSGFYGVREQFTKKILRLREKYLKDERIDVIHAHCCVWAGSAAKALSERINVPYVITEHSSLFGLNGNLLAGRHYDAAASAFQKAGKVICVSEALKSEIKEFRNDAAVIGNIIDCDLFDADHSNASEKKTFTFFTLFYMKNLAQIQNKGFDVLLKALSKIKDKDIRLLVGGGGDGESIARQWIEENKLENKVTLLGALSREQVVSYMQKCDCFVLPSRYETFGVSYVEAMACGKPVIATKTGGPVGFVNETNGILVGIDNADELAEAMQRVMEDYEKYDPLSIRHQIETSFSAGAIAGQLLNVYKRIT